MIPPTSRLIRTGALACASLVLPALAGPAAADARHTSEAEAPAASVSRLLATQRAKAAPMTLAADAITLSTATNATTYAYDEASGTLGAQLERAEGSGPRVWSPGGDVALDGTGATWTTRSRSGSALATYPRVSGAVNPGWFPTGDGFVAQSPTSAPYSSAISMTPGKHWSQALTAAGATYGAFAVSPYGTEAVTRGVSGASSNLYLVPVRGPMKLTGQPAPFPTRDYFVSSYRPGNPDIAQEPGKGVRDASARTFISFLGVEPGTTKAALFVDYQDGRHLNAPLQPTAVVQAGMPCTTAAPAFSPDRRRIAYLVGVAAGTSPCTQTAVRVVTLGSNGFYDPASVTTLIASPAGDPFTTISWRARTAPAQSVRIGGRDRYEVGVNVSRSVYGEQSAGGAVVAGGEAYADALAGSPLAAALKGPLMLTRRDRVEPGVVAELTRSLRPGSPIYVLGGPATVSESVLASLRATGHPVTRVGGANRFAVAAAVADTLTQVRGSAPAAIFVANGRVFPDALVSSPAATATKGIILLSDEDRLPTESAAYLQANPGAARFGIGGGGSRSLAGLTGVEVISGADRYEVATKVADRFFTAEWISTIVSGLNWPDATTGGALISQWQQPILLAKGSELPAFTAGRLDRSRAATDLVVAFGGPDSVSDAALAEAVTRAGTQTRYFGPDAPR